ncbi:MAG: hypothetical protein ACE5GW_07295 [Planctomycetota bacterium]
MGCWLKNSPLILELVPPPLRLGPEGLEKRLRRLERIIGQIPLHGVNIPEIREEESKSDRGERKTPFEPRVAPRELARLVRRRFGLETIVNRVVVHRRAEDQARWFRQTRADYGIRNFVLVGGERNDVEYPGPTVAEANRLIREVLPEEGIEVGNICIPNRRAPPLDEPERMEEKATSGARFFTTQITYHASEFTALLDDLSERAPQASATPILLSVCPLRSPQSVAFLHWLGVTLDEPLRARLTAGGGSVLERSIEHLAGMWGRIQAHIERRRIPTPVGVNIAPVGPIPASAVVQLASRLQEHLSQPRG